MTDRKATPDRRTRDLRDTALWERDLNGYAVCPWCAAMVYSPRSDIHRDRCVAAQPERRSGTDPDTGAGE